MPHHVSFLRKKNAKMKLTLLNLRFKVTEFESQARHILQ